MATELGEPEVMKGYGMRNATLMAIAPTTSSAFILGQVSQGIEPVWSNCYIKDVAKAKVVIKNNQLLELLEQKGENTKETWHSIRDHDGSVQHLNCLSENEKAVFKTFGEINQEEIIDQAGDRQQFIDQGQSLNIKAHPNVSAKEMNILALKAWDSGIKALYYQHSDNAAQSMVRERQAKK
jgi:ribonucleoside-diphosphate reductase alpha chain